MPKFTKKFSVENTGNATASYSIILDQKENGFKRSEDWTYKLYKGETTSGSPIASGTIAVGSEQILYGKAEVDDKQTNNYVLEIEYVNLKDVDQSEDMNKRLSFRVNIAEERVTWDSAPEGTLLNAIKTNTKEIQKAPETTPGKEPSGENEKVLATTDDDYGTSHYFRGAVDNNYINFGNMCWRIVRVQGDGSIKIVLADGSHTCENESFGDGSAFITNSNSNVVEVRYGDSNDTKYSSSYVSRISSKWLDGGTVEIQAPDGPDIEATYTFEAKAIDKTKLVEAEWCNDFSILLDEVSSGSRGYFGPAYRLGPILMSPTFDGTGPSLKCNFQASDGYSKANKHISNIGVLSADEVAFAGFSVGTTGATDQSSYLVNDAGDYWYTLSPYSADYASMDMITVGSKGFALASVYSSGNNKAYIRPTLVLKSDVKVAESGNGSTTSPYVIE